MSASSEPLHVALLADGVYPYRLGGIQRHTRMLALHFAKAGVRVTLLHSADTPELRARAQALVARGEAVSLNASAREQSPVPAAA